MGIPDEIYENGLGEYIDEDLEEDWDKINRIKMIPGSLEELENIIGSELKIIGMVSKEETFGPEDHPSQLFNATKRVKKEIKKQAFYLGCEGIYDFSIYKKTTPVPDPRGHNTKFVQDIQARGMAASKTEPSIKDS